MTYDDQLKFFCFYKPRERQLEATAAITLLIGRLIGWPLDKMRGLWNTPFQLLCTYSLCPLKRTAQTNHLRAKPS
jgi:hypothetical protein